MKRSISIPFSKQLALSRANKRAMMHFAEAMGMVYFGHVDRNSDDAQLIRGLTVSSHHRDKHYSVGSLYGYDVAFVERTDRITFPGKIPSDHRWTIMQFDLHTSNDLPHIFLGLHTHSEAFYASLFAKFSTLQRAPLGTFGMYDPAFTDRYAIYTKPAESLTAERLFDAEVTRTLLRHFGTITLEVHEGSLYLYSEHKRVTIALLETMLKNGIWLAKHLDERAALI